MMGGTFAIMGQNCMQGCVWKALRLFRGTRHPSDSNIKIDFKETGLKSEN